MHRLQNRKTRLTVMLSVYAGLDFRFENWNVDISVGSVGHRATEYQAVWTLEPNARSCQRLDFATPGFGNLGLNAEALDTPQFPESVRIPMYLDCN